MFTALSDCVLLFHLGIWSFYNLWLFLDLVISRIHFKLIEFGADKIS